MTKLDPKLPALVGWIVQRCLARDPEERYSSTKDLAKELRNLRTHLSEAVTAASVAPGEGPRLRRRVPYWALAAAVALTAAVGLFAGIRFSRSASPPATPLRFSLSFPVDAAPRTHEHNPFALSPDRKTLVFEGVSEGGRLARSKLFVRRLDLDEIRPIPGTDATGADFPFSSPFMSPDGLEVGFFAEKKLKKVSLAGGSPITLRDAPSPRGGSWGADGTIVFVPSPTSGLWRIPASGGEARRVTNPDVAKGDRHSFPQILPDGEHVLFTFFGTGTSGTAVDLFARASSASSWRTPDAPVSPDGAPRLRSSRHASRRPVQPEASRNLRLPRAGPRRSRDEFHLHPGCPIRLLGGRNARLRSEPAASENARLGGSERRDGAGSSPARGLRGGGPLA